ncbi:N-methyl-L-tryptophan oxidase [Hyphobacterium sp. HN65]|uniref:N-methyl-L-tryptophan oxidase n=1 Tax=Hyphobacterium lacteum TaxID=3116575 RepID=A0ABU7LSK6_9PROT|nr:N-methyl-L-tryptophan oxidase [Hyphobacterium sp. HN65]MEE2526901.1 N-methyl-L-tryptophan oxidase [Hyphobacterium sp. HN65]
MHEIGIIGLGAMGLASAWMASRKGLSVTGFDRFERGHSSGSSHGETRMIRRIYSEGTLYTGILDRAYALWPELEADTGERLFIETGGLDIGIAGSDFIAEALASADASGQAFEVLEAGELRQRFPAMDLPDDLMAIHAPGSGYLRSDAANAAMAGLAEANGAALHWACPVIRVETRPEGFRLHTSYGHHDVKRLINTAGPWAGDFHAGLESALTVERQVIGWFDGPQNVPPFQRVFPDGRRIYVLPGGTPERWKLGLYHHREEQGPDYRDTIEADETDRAILTDCVKAVLPHCTAPDDFGVCRFTNTRDHRFIIDTAEDGAILIAACSGHGYKFAPAVGEAALALAIGETPAFDLSDFTLAGQTKL